MVPLDAGKRRIRNASIHSGEGPVTKLANRQGSLTCLRTSTLISLDLKAGQDVNA